MLIVLQDPGDVWLGVHGAWCMVDAGRLRLGFHTGQWQIATTTSWHLSGTGDC